MPRQIQHFWFALGGTAAYLFGVQVITGILLAILLVAQTAGAAVFLRKVHRSWQSK